MKFLKKDWKKVIIMLLLCLFIMIIYKFNSSGKENPEVELFSSTNNKNSNNTAGNTSNNNNKFDPDVANDLAEPLSALAGVSSNRIENIKVTGVDPDIQIYFDLLPRSVHDIQEPSLEDITKKLEGLGINMDYIINVDGKDHHFKSVHIQQKIKPQTNIDELTSRFVDPTLKTQIKNLRDLQSLITGDYETDNFYTFNKNGNLELKPNSSSSKLLNLNNNKIKNQSINQSTNQLPDIAEPATGEINSTPNSTTVESFTGNNYRKIF